MHEDYSTSIQIGRETYDLILTTHATKAIAKRYGGLENLGEKLLKTENFELALEEILWLIMTLANQSIKIHNLTNKEKKEELTEEVIELLTTPYDLMQYKEAITQAMMKGTNRVIESVEEGKNEPSE